MRLFLAACAALFLVAIATLVFPVPAEAQAVADNRQFVTLAPWWTIVEPFILAAVPLIGAWIGTMIRSSFLRAAFQTALTNAAGLAVHRIGAKVSGMSLDVRNKHAKELILYVERSAPGAIKKWKITPESIVQKIEAKIPQILGPVVAMDGPAVTPSKGGPEHRLPADRNPSPNR